MNFNFSFNRFFTLKFCVHGIFITRTLPEKFSYNFSLLFSFVWASCFEWFGFSKTVDFYTETYVVISGWWRMEEKKIMKTRSEEGSERMCRCQAWWNVNNRLRTQTSLQKTRSRDVLLFWFYFYSHSFRDSFFAFANWVCVRMQTNIYSIRFFFWRCVNRNWMQKISTGLFFRVDL